MADAAIPVLCGTAKLPGGSPHAIIPHYSSTRNSLTFVNTTAIAYIQKVGRSLKTLVYAIAVVFTNVRELRVP